MDQALALNILTMPRRSNTPPKVDYIEHYRYYHNRGHSTEECNAFEDKIEEFIKLDHLNDFFLFLFEPLFLFLNLFVLNFKRCFTADPTTYKTSNI